LVDFVDGKCFADSVIDLLKSFGDTTFRELENGFVGVHFR
jgi:hypothetical protein